MLVREDHPSILCARQVALRLQSMEEVKRFQLAEKQVEGSQTVRRYIEQIKKKQKELVHAKHYQKQGYVAVLEKELADLQYQLDHLPIVREYQQSQVVVNDLLQGIQKIILDNLSTIISVEAGGEVVQGCGNRGSCK